ncbi:MAG: gamma-glutamyl-phosphate reductase, partial [Alphaproteobacteria bacterium]
MTIQEKLSNEGSIAEIMERLGKNARAAARTLATVPTDAKDKALLEGAKALRNGCAEILAANAKDMKAAEEKGLSAALLDRLLLTEDRVGAMASGLEAIAELPDPVGDVMTEWDRPNGLEISRVRVPLGVIGIIYESRPNVTADASSL